MPLPISEKLSSKYGIIAIGSITFFIAAGLLYYLHWQSNLPQEGAQPISAEELRSDDAFRQPLAAAQNGDPSAAWTEEDKLLILDVRPTTAYETSHLQGSQTVPIEWLAQSTIDADATILLYSEDSLELKQAELTLRKKGITRIYLLQEPLTTYQDLGYNVYVHP